MCLYQNTIPLAFDDSYIQEKMLLFFKLPRSSGEHERGSANILRVGDVGTASAGSTDNNLHPLFELSTCSLLREVWEKFVLAH